MNHRKSLWLILGMTLLLAGCWDTINVEDRGFIVGAAVDLAESDDQENPVFSITNQVVLPQGYAANPAQGSADQKVFLNLTAKGRGIYRINDDMAAKMSKTPYFGHMKVIVISEELAKQKDALVKMLDYYLRDVDIRRGVLLTVSKGDAKSILGTKQPENQLPSLSLRKLLEQSSEKTGYFEPLSIGDVEALNMVNHSFVLPYLTTEDQIERKSGAVFHGPHKRMVGKLATGELQGMELFSGKAKQALVDFPFKNSTYGLKVIRLRRKVTIDTSNISRLKIHNELTIEGVLNESKSEENFMKAGEIDRVEEAVSKEVKKNVMTTINKAQKEWNADIFNLWEQLETKHYDTWKKVEDDWESGENYFSQAEIDINVNTYIYSTGSSNKTN